MLEDTFLDSKGQVMTWSRYLAFSERCQTGLNPRIPEPTRVEYWDFSHQTTTIYEKRNRDANNMTWLNTLQSIYQSQTPLLNGTAGAPQGELVAQKEIVRALDSDLPAWLVLREKSVVTNRLVDATGHCSVTLSGGAQESILERTFLPGFNSVLSETHQGILQLAWEYPSRSGLGAANPSGVSLKAVGGASFRNNGLVGGLYSYDSLGRLSSIQPRGAGWSFRREMDLYGRPQRDIDPDGRVTTYDWDSMGRLVSIVPPGGQAATSIDYPDAVTAKVKVTGAMGPAQAPTTLETVYRFNGFGALVGMERPGGGRKILEYEPGRNLLVRESVWFANQDASGVAGTAYEHDDWGRQTKLTTPNGEVRTIAYDGFKQTIQTGLQANSPVTLQVYDPLGQLASVRSSDGAGNVLSEVHYRYDLQGALAESIQSGDGRSQVRTWQRNPLGWLESTGSPEEGTWFYSDFDVAGNAWVINHAGRVLNASYDPLSRLTSMMSSDSNHPVDSEYRYDNAPDAVGGNGKLRWDRNGSITRTFTYAPETGLPASLLVEIPGLLDQPIRQGYGHDAFGNRISSVLEGRETLVSFGRLAMPEWVNYQGVRVAEPSYEPVSQTLDSIAWKTGVRSLFTYRADQTTLQTMEHLFQDRPGWSPLQRRWCLAYDSCGRLISDGMDIYEYDGLGRLTYARTSWKEGLDSVRLRTLYQTFGYDSFGNRYKVSSKDDQNAFSGLPVELRSNYAFDPGDPAVWRHNQLPGDSVAGAQYDPQGNLVQVFMTPGGAGQDIRSMSYDALGRMRSMTDERTGRAEVYGYTADGLRTLIEEWQGGVLTRKWINIYNDLRQLVGQWVVE